MNKALVTCITPTARRAEWLRHAADYLSSAPGVCEWIVMLDEGDEQNVSPSGAVHTQPIVVRAGTSIGAKRNLACERATGDIIIHWDDDDWYAPWRIEFQVDELLSSGADICGADHLLYYEPSRGRAWEYTYPSGARPWVAGNTLCYRRAFWERHRFPEIQIGEDSRFVRACSPARLHRHPRTDFVVGLIHDGNTSRKPTAHAWWHSRPVADVERVMGSAINRYRTHAVASTSLTPSTVRASSSSSSSSSVTAVRTRRAKATAPAVMYHGPVFDGSGYGQAARAYVHALHEAGVTLSVVNLLVGAPQVRDALVESLVGRELTPDVHLYHGVPPLWARDTLRQQRYVAITVWETDTMPAQWREPLWRALDVWMPCDFNVTVFERELGRSVFKLPFPIPPTSTARADSTRLGVAADEFVFYSIFEWQDRKGPVEQINAFFRTFTKSDRAVLLIKTNATAKKAAQSVLAALRRRAGSTARVVLSCELWNEAQIAALHTRGDCYVSLHRGEGWGYPLFEAALRGTPVVATAFAGPLEYLDASHHELVSYVEGPVRQRSTFYDPAMRWAEPDVADAARRMRWVFEHRETARARAAAHAPVLQTRYAPRTIGAIARNRLVELLRTIDTRRDAPMPASWFDEDYFERGRKNAWTRGYSWREFGLLFRETAAWLSSVFPTARTYLDAGCAKGFLVRALREAKCEAWGCDISPWAIAHAEDAARDYLRLGAAEDTPWDGEHDVLTAFHLLPQMSESQIDRFLTGARGRTRIAVLAVIPLVDEASGTPAGEGDYGHVTRRTRAWWHERFLAAGWRQDPLHRAMEHACQAHQLPRRMGWDVFLYSSGR